MIVEMESRKIRRNELVENTRRKTRREATRLKLSSQVQKIISDKYSANFVIILCYEVLNNYEALHCKL